MYRGPFTSVQEFLQSFVTVPFVGGNEVHRFDIGLYINDVTVEKFKWGIDLMTVLLPDGIN